MARHRSLLEEKGFPSWVIQLKHLPESFLSFLEECGPDNRTDVVYSVSANHSAVRWMTLSAIV
jgi:hypothetical protein